MGSERHGIFSLGKKIREEPYGAGFFAVSLIFLTFASYVDYWSGLFPEIEALSAAMVVIFFVYSVAFFSCGKRYGRKSRIAMQAAFLLSLAVAASVIFLAGGRIGTYIALSFLYVSGPVVEYTIVFVFFLSLVSFGAFLLKKGYRQGYLLMAVAFLFFILPYYTVLASKAVVISDEAFIGFADSGLLLHGTNPYAVSVSGILLSNYTAGKVNSLTYTTSNKAIGILNYPDVFLFASLPFYYISEMAGRGFVLATKLQIGIFLFVLLFVIARYVSTDSYKKPLIGLSFTIAFLLGTISAPFELLMLAAIILAYIKLDSKYSWVLLGACLAMQELLWLPVVLLLAYKTMDSGIRKGILSAVGSVLVFFALNAYFIAIGPAAFVHGIFDPIGNIIPDAGGVFGYLIAVAYGTSISISGIIIGIVSLFSLAAFLYAGEKKLIPLLSLLPLEFLSHNLLYYPVFFIAFAFAALAIKENGKAAGKIVVPACWKKILAAMMIALILSGTAVVLYSHSEYMKYFGMRLEPDKSSISTTGTLVEYSLLFRGSCMESCRNLSVLLFGFGGNGPGFFSLENKQGIGNAVPEYDPLNSGYYANASINTNGTGGVYAAQMAIYNDTYAHFTEEFYHGLR